MVQSLPERSTRRNRQNYTRNAVPISQYASYSLIFSPLHSIINREQHKKYLYNQSSHSGKYGMFDRWSACLIYQFRVGVSGVLLCFISLLVIRTCWTAFQAKNNVRSAPAGFALTLVWHQSHKAHTTNRHLCTKGERNGWLEYKGEQR